MPVASDDVETLLGRAFTAGETSRVDRLIELAQAKLESTIPGLTLNEGTETATIQPGDPDVYWTPRYPVTAITTIGSDGNDITGYLWDSWGRIRVNVTTLNDWELNYPLTPGAEVDITYSYGFEVIPDDIAGTVAAMAASAIRRQATNPDNVQSEALGAYQVSYGDWAVKEAAAGLTVPEGALRNWRRNRQVSVPLVRYR